MLRELPAKGAVGKVGKLRPEVWRTEGYQPFYSRRGAKKSSCRLCIHSALAVPCYNHAVRFEIAANLTQLPREHPAVLPHIKWLLAICGKAHESCSEAVVQGKSIEVIYAVRLIVSPKRGRITAEPRHKDDNRKISAALRRRARIPPTMPLVVKGIYKPWVGRLFWSAADIVINNKSRSRECQILIPIKFTININQS
jgi:hypothetical protein